MRILVVNDTSSYHAGSTAVMKTLRTALMAQGHSLWTYGRGTVLPAVDAVVVNGEGTLHHKGRDFWIFELLREAQERGIATYLVNTVWDTNDVDYKILQRLDGVNVRDLCSYYQLRKLGVKALVCPDLAYFAPLNDSTEYINFNGGMVAGDWFAPQPASDEIIAIRFPYRLTFKPKMTDWGTIVRSLCTASLYVTGRHHGVIAACKARCPFIAYKHNCHKIKGIFKWAGVKIPIPTNWQQVLNMVQWTKNHRSDFDKLFDFLEKQQLDVGV